MASLIPTPPPPGMFCSEKTKSDKLKKTLLKTDLIAMHDLLSKNMYKIRERVSSMLCGT